MFAGGNVAPGPGGFGFGRSIEDGSIFGADLAGAALFGAPRASADARDAATPVGADGNGAIGSAPPMSHGVGAIDRPGSTAVALPSSGDFTLSGFADPREFSNMCREMGLEDPSAPARDAGVAAGVAGSGAVGGAGGTLDPSQGGRGPSKPASASPAFASAAPGELAGRARREVLAEFAPGAGEATVTVGGILENDMFSLTQMLGDVPAEHGATRDVATLGTHAGGAGGPTSFAGMFSGNLADAMGAKPAR